LKNLLANAFKFTAHGRISLRVDLAPRRVRFANGSLGDATQVLSFSVSDTGIGIPRDKLQIIFEAFQQADGTTSRRYGGTGLGLSISREIAKLLGGEIHVQSTPGAGSTFTLYLPQDRVWEMAEVAVPGDIPAPAADAPATAAEDAALAGKKVLVIDDDVRNVFAVTSLLESHEAEVVYALDGKAGLEALRANGRISAVLLDMMMPEMDGDETLAAIRREPSLASLPVIVVTAKALKEDHDRCLTAGATDYLCKPVDGEKLVEMLRRWTSLDRGRSAA
jgi:CheY-like chemotaxis protein